VLLRPVGPAIQHWQWDRPPEIDLAHFPREVGDEHQGSRTQRLLLAKRSKQVERRLTTPAMPQGIEQALDR
jgi:hypothetical protein